jgi:hypothetical protein
VRRVLAILAVLLVTACAARPHPVAWTHPTALYHDAHGAIVGTPPPRTGGNQGLPWVEVYVSSPGGAMNKARVWGWSEQEAMRDAEIVARALGR